MAAIICLLVSLIILIYVQDLNAGKYMIACFFNSSARFRPEGGRFNVQDIDFTLCTHYIYLSAVIDAPNQTIAASDPDVEEGNSSMYKEFNGGKLLNPKLKTLLSVGGPGKNIDASFQALLAHDQSFMAFSMNAIQFVKQYGFNGINIHWEMAKVNTGKGDFITLLERLKSVMDLEKDMLLTITGFGLTTLVQSRYDVPKMQKLVNYVFVQCKDMIAQNTASFIGPLFYNRNNPSSFKNMIKYVKQYGLAGMAFTNIDEDDFNGTACKAGRYPLVTFLRQELNTTDKATHPGMGTSTRVTSPRPSTAVRKATSAMQTMASSITTKGDDTITTTATEKFKLKETNKELVTILGYLLLIFLFVIGHIIGYLFMKIVRYIYICFSKE